MRAFALVVRFGIPGFVLAATSLLAQSAEHQTTLQQQVATIAQDARGTVSVACLLPGTALNCDLHPHNHPPMQSMFKFPLGLTVLHLADEGRLPGQRPGEPIRDTLDRPLRFLPEDRIAHSFSPMTDRYPEANVDVPLRELLTYAVGQSDNAATDTLQRTVGGPAVIQAYLRSLLGNSAFQMQSGEQEMDKDPQAQYGNWIEPAAAARLLQLLVTHSPLKPDTNAFLLHVMTASQTGAHRLRAGLPPGTPLAHKTGTSGVHGGVAAATNDIGLITLPDGRHLAVAVFVTDARADEPTREAVIATIGQAAYTAALTTH